MANLANINISITASDNTGSGVNSALSNLSRLGGGIGSIGSIAAGVFGGVLGFATFNNISRGIGSVISSAFGLNNRMAESRAAATSMVNAIAESEPVGTGAFGALSKAAQAYERTLREVQEREQDGLTDYAEKVDSIKEKILESRQDLARRLASIAADEKRDLDDLNESHLESIQDFNSRILDENYDFNERLIDMANSRQDKLDNLEDSHTDKVSTLNEKIIDAEEEVLTATTAFDQQRAQAKLDLLNSQLAEENASYEAQKNKINERADHEIQVFTDKHNRELAALQLKIDRENAEYTKRKARIEKDADDEIAEAERVSKEKIASLNQQLTQEKAQHERFLRDIKEAYEDAARKMDESMTGGGAGGPGGKRTIQFKFDFGDAFRSMTQSGLTEYLDAVQKKYVEIGVKTPFNIADIQHAGKAMVAYTGGSADNMQKILEATVSLAARNPMQGMLGATQAMVELFGSGNIVSLARRFDIPKATLAGLSEAKNETEFISLLTQALERNGITMGLVDAKAQTLGGAFGNLMETFNLVTAAIAKSTWDSLTEKLVNINAWLFYNQDAVVAWAGALSSAVAPAISLIVDGLFKMGQGFGNFLASNAGPIQEWVGNFSKSIIELLIPTLDFLSQVWQSVQKTLEDTIIPGLGRIFAKLGELWTVIYPLLKKTLEDVGKFWKDHHTQIEAIAKGTWALIEFVIKTALDIISGFIKTYTAIMKGDWTGAWTSIKDTVGNIFNNIVELGKGLWASLSSHFKSGINAIIDQINGFLNSLKQFTTLKINGKVIVSAIEVPQIPKLAAGGIALGPTLALIGEAGPEAVVPLSKGAGGFGGGTQIHVTITGNNILDDETAGTLADKVGEAIVNRIALQGRYL